MSNPSQRLPARDWLWIGLLSLTALALRCYQLAGSPVWLDEAVSMWIVRQGPVAIVANSLRDPHPPGWYLLFWLTTGLGSLHSEWGARWPSVLAGAGAVALTTLTARRHVGLPAALGAGLLFAAAPLHLFFSQEARPPAMIVLAAAASALAFEHVLARPDDRRALLALILCALAGLYLGYFFVLVAGVQALALIALRLWRPALAYCASLALLGAPVAFFFLRGVPNIAAKHDQQAPQFFAFAQALLGGEPVRFGFGWWHPLLLALVGGLALFALPAARRDRALAYHAAQVALPLAGFWLVLVGLLGLGLPLNEAKQFMVLLPSLFVLAAVGLERVAALLPGVGGRAMAAGLCAAAVVAGLASAGHAWGQTKSPEGLAVRALEALEAPGDARVFLTYSPALIFDFYRPGEPYFTYASWAPDGAPNLDGAYLEADAPPGHGVVVPTDQTLAAPRILLIADTRRPEPAQAWIAARCSGASQGLYGPFELLIYEDCAP